MGKITFRTASSKKNVFDRSSMHITTLDFSRPIVSNFLPVTRGDSVHVRLNQFMRLSPLAVPTYGNFKLVTRAFFTPMRLLSSNWHDFMAQMKGSTERSLPWTTVSRIVDTIVDNYTIAGTSDHYDFVLHGSSGVAYYILTDKGRAFVSLLNSLGYEFNFSLSDKTGVSLMPMLAYLRVFYDVMYPTRYLDASVWGPLFTLYSYKEESDAQIILTSFEDTLNVFYENDFFVECWKSFNSANGLNPINNLSNDQFTVRDISVGGTTRSLVVDSGSVRINATPNKENTAVSTISSYGHRLLDALSDFTLRNNLAGSRFLEYIKAHFGFTTSSENEQYTQYLGSYVHNTNIMDVTSTAETTGTDGDVLGAQAGKGYINGDGKLSYDCKEHGYILFVTMLMPSYGYYQGLKPWCLHKTSPLDYYTPEMDSLGNEAIPNCFVYADYKDDSQYTNGDKHGGKPLNVFGFAPRYAFEYKTGHDFLTGDFRFNSRNVGLNSFHTFREIDPPSPSKPLVQGISFATVDNQYDRVFSSNYQRSDSSNYDHFIGYFQFNIKVYSNMLSISQSLPFYEDEGREVTVAKQ